MLLDKDEERCRGTAEVLRPIGPRTLALACDIADPQSVAAAEHASRAIGPCDILVNNAGVLLPGSLATVPLEEWNLLLSVNLTGYLLCAQAFGKAMIEPWAWRHRAHGVHCRQQRAGVLRRLQRQQGWRSDAVASARGGVGAAWGSKQRNQPGSGADTDE